MIDENELIPFQYSSLPLGDWLVFAPHPDDETLGMGGAFALAKLESIKITVVFLTDGSFGGSSPNLVTTRELEAEAALSILGVKNYQFWKLRDRMFKVDRELIERVKKIIIETKPSSVFFPTPLEFHPDHRRTAHLVWKSLQEIKFCEKAYAYQISVQAPTNFLLDITNVIEIKKEAMSAYQTQLNENRYVEVILGLNAARSYTLPPHVHYAEAFYLYDDIFGDLWKTFIWELRNYWRQEYIEFCPLVSIIIRTRNRLTLLEQAIESVCNQTYQNIEIIVVNDGGEDVTAVLNSFRLQCKNVRLIDLEKNHGRSRAANVGIKAANGEFIAFLDDDDLYFTDGIAKVISPMLANNFAVAYGKVVYAHYDFQSMKRLDDTLTYIYEVPFSYELLLVENFIPLNALLFRRYIFDNCGFFDESLELNEDWCLLLKIAEIYHFEFIPEFIAEYRSFGVSTVGGGRFSDVEIANFSQSIIELNWYKIKPSTFQIFHNYLYTMYQNKSSFYRQRYRLIKNDLIKSNTRLKELEMVGIEMEQAREYIAHLEENMNVLEQAREYIAKLEENTRILEDARIYIVELEARIAKLECHN